MIYKECQKELQNITGLKRVEKTTGDKIKEDTFALILKKNKTWRRGNIGMKEKIEIVELQKLLKKKIRRDI